MFYVYLHKRATDGSVFYVGKGKGRRAYWKNQRNKHWHSVVKKNGYTVEIYKDGLSEDEAFSLEIEMIEKIGMDNLCNYTVGGDGASGAVKTDEQKLHMSKKMKGRTFSEETIEKMSAAAKARPESCRVRQANAIRGRKHTEEHKRKISESCKGKVLSPEARKKISDYHKGKKKKPEAVLAMAASKSKPVKCLNNGVIYKSQAEAARQLGISSNHISAVVCGKARSTMGFVFEAVKDEA